MDLTQLVRSFPSVLSQSSTSTEQRSQVGEGRAAAAAAGGRGGGAPRPPEPSNNAVDMAPAALMRDVDAASRELAGKQVVLIVFGGDGAPFADQDCLLNVWEATATSISGKWVTKGFGEYEAQSRRHPILMERLQSPYDIQGSPPSAVTLFCLGAVDHGIRPGVRMFALSMCRWKSARQPSTNRPPEPQRRRQQVQRLSADLSPGWYTQLCDVFAPSVKMQLQWTQRF